MLSDYDKTFIDAFPNAVVSDQIYRLIDATYAKGFRDGERLGIERVRGQADAWLDGRERMMALQCVTAAIEAFEKEQADER